MKVLYVSSVNSSIKAGYYHAVVDRVKGLKSQGINITSVNFNRENFKSDDFDYDIFFPRVFNSRYAMAYITELFILFRLFVICRRHEFDLIHVHWAYPIGYAVSIISRLKKIPFVLTCHGSDIHTHPRKNNLVMRRTDSTLRAAAGVFFVSQGLKQEAINLFDGLDNKRLTVSYNGVDVSEQGSHIKSKSSKSERKVLYIGNLNRTKGSDRLPGIIEGIAAGYRGDVKFIIYGDGELYNSLKLDQTLIRNNVHFRGRVSRLEIEKGISRADLVIVPSRKEGFGLVALESFLLGTPCIAYNIDGLREVFKYNLNYLANDKNEFISLSVSVLNNDKERICLSQKKYIIEFSMDSILKKEIIEYKKILQRFSVL